LPKLPKIVEIEKPTLNQMKPVDCKSGSQKLLPRINADGRGWEECHAVAIQLLLDW
jgi:hypothetical protein